MTGKPNAGQEAAAEAFFSFLHTPEKEFRISGAAGVGKTFLMQHIIDTVIPQYHETCKIIGVEPEYNSVVMTATTNKAAEVLAVATKRPTQTIHSFLNLKVKEDYTSGRSILSKTTSWVVHQNKIIFIDEASMIDTPLMNLIHEGTHQCKIVYVGDKNQLNPVMEDISPVFREDLPLFELTEQMRNTGQPALMDLCQQLRETVVSGEFKPIKIIPGVIDYLDDDRMQEEIEKHFSNQNPYSRILAYTNTRVLQFNDHIRAIRNLPTEFTIGEALVNNQSIRLGNYQLSVEEEVTIVQMDTDVSYEKVLPTVDFAYRRATIVTGLGRTIENVKIPQDREHYSSLIKFFARQKNWERYFYMKQNFPDLRQRDAATVHKSQGSTYDSVFVDLGDLSTCTSNDQVARLLYVACSRPRNRVFFYGELKDRFGGLIK